MKIHASESNESLLSYCRAQLDLSKEIKKIAEGKNFNAVDFGKMSELGEYVLAMGDA